MKPPTNELGPLSRAIETKEPVTIFLLNGYQFQGVIAGCVDGLVIVDIDEDTRWCVYKHAISTIAISKR